MQARWLNSNQSVYRPHEVLQMGVYAHMRTRAACHMVSAERLSLAQHVAQAGVFVKLRFGIRAQRDDFEIFLAGECHQGIQ